MTLHQTLYRKLTVLIPTLPEVPEYVKSQVPGFMDLNLDVLSRNDEIITIALSYYYEQNGDLTPGPDRLIPSKDTCEGMSRSSAKGLVC